MSSTQGNRASLVAQLVKNLPAMKETWVWSLGWEDPLEKEKAMHSSILAWRIPWTVHGDSLGKNTRVGCHALLQGIFPTKGSNPGLPHCRRQILYHLSHQGSLRILEWIPSSRDLPNPGIKPGSPALQADSFPAELPGKLTCLLTGRHIWGENPLILLVPAALAEAECSVQFWKAYFPHLQTSCTSGRIANNLSYYVISARGTKTSLALP